MPTQLLSLGPPTTLIQNVVYALPAQLCQINASIACEVSSNQSTWTALANDATTSAGFIRCPTGNAVVTVKSATKVGSPSGGGSLPTAALGQVLVSQGAGVAPVFSDDVVLNSANPGIIIIDNSQPADQRRWHLWPMAGGYFNFDCENDAGVLISRIVYLNRSTGQLVTNQAISCPVIVIQNRIDLGEVPVNGVNGQGVGAIANFSDSTVNTIGAIIAGGGTNHVLGRWNGTNWKVIGV